MSETKLLADSSVGLNGVMVERDNRSVAVIELIVTADGACGATAQLFGSVNGAAGTETDLGSITASGTNAASVIDTVEVPYRFFRVVLSGVTGPNARAICTHSST